MPAIEERTLDQVLDEKPVSVPQQESAMSGPTWQEILTKQSPDKSIEEYQNHPLNFAHDNALGRALRGAEGLLGTLNYALIDLVWGLFEYISKKAASAFSRPA